MNCSWAELALRSDRIAGKAMLTMKKSRKARNEPIRMMGSARHRRGSRLAVSIVSSPAEPSGRTLRVPAYSWKTPWTVSRPIVFTANPISLRSASIFHTPSGSGSPAVPQGDDRSQAAERKENAPCLVVRLASTRLAAEDVANLEVGDMIVTDCDPARAVTVFLEGTARFSGFAGLVKDRKAVRLGAALGERPASEMPGSGPGETAAAD